MPHQYTGTAGSKTWTETVSQVSWQHEVLRHHEDDICYRGHTLSAWEAGPRGCRGEWAASPRTRSSAASTTPSATSTTRRTTTAQPGSGGELEMLFWQDNRSRNSFREFKPREQTAEIVKIPETEEDTKKPVETRFDETENGSQADNEDKFKRTKSTKSNKSLTLPLDPVKRKDSGASSRDFSTVTLSHTETGYRHQVMPGQHPNTRRVHTKDQDHGRGILPWVRVPGLGGGGYHQAHPNLDLSPARLWNTFWRWFYLIKAKTVHFSRKIVG